MIYDKLENIENYKGISKWMEEAVSFLQRTDLDKLPLGKIEICSDKVYVNVMEVEAVEENDIDFEIHKKYIDIQIDIEGVELLQVGIETGEIIKSYSEDNDFATARCDQFLPCVLGPGRFVVCMGQEPHKPSIAISENRHLKKCVVKVAVD